jgi:hypothetical protein
VDRIRHLSRGWYSTTAFVLWVAGWGGILAMTVGPPALGVVGVILLALAGLAEYRARSDAHPEARGMMRDAR